MHVLLDHMLIVRIWRMYTAIGRTIHTYIYIYHRNSAVELTSVGLTHARPNYTVDIQKYNVTRTQ